MTSSHSAKVPIFADASYLEGHFWRSVICDDVVLVSLKGAVAIHLSGSYLSPPSLLLGLCYCVMVIEEEKDTLLLPT